MPTIDKKERKLYEDRLAALKSNAAPKIRQWKEIREYIFPHSGRFDGEKPDSVRENDNPLINTFATWCCNILASGITSGVANPSDQWLAFESIEKIETHESFVWLRRHADKMLGIFDHSDIYRSQASLIKEELGYGIGAYLIVEDDNTVISAHSLTIGEYYIALDANQEVDTLYRTMQCSTAALVRQFGIDNVSDKVKRDYETGNLDVLVEIAHAIEPNHNRDETKLNSKNMAYTSIYWELDGEKDVILDRSGFKSFPAIVGRWDVYASNVYGSSPGMEALESAKMLQNRELVSKMLWDRFFKPPLKVSPALQPEFERQNVFAPGAVVYAADDLSAKPLFELNFERMAETANNEIIRYQQNIERAFLTEAFAPVPQQNVTATAANLEWNKRAAVLGPNLDRILKQIDSLISITWDIMARKGLIEPPPPELAGKAIKPVLISQLALARRAANAENTMGFAQQIIYLNENLPGAADIINPDKFSRSIGRDRSIDPSILNSEDDIAAKREAQAQQAQQQQMAEQQNLAADTARKASQASLEGDNMLTAQAAAMQQMQEQQQAP